MSLLFDRSYTLTVGTFQVTDLQLRFSIHKDIKPNANKAEFHIFNLSADHCFELASLSEEVPVQFEAGYKGSTSVIFLGQLRTSFTVRDGPDLISTVSSGDSKKAIKANRASLSFKKGTSSGEVLKAIAAQLGVAKGNLDKAVASLASNVSNIFPAGTVVHGNAAREMTRLCFALGLEWSIQDGKLQILDRKKALDATAVVISEATGLIGSPTVDNLGVLKCRVLLIPDLYPGRKVVLDSESVAGQFRCEKTTHAGDYEGKDWFTNIEARVY